MPNPKKVEIVEQITEKFKKSKGMYFVDFLGMNVEQVNSLRKEMRNANIDYRVLKNTLLRLAADKSGLNENVKKFFTGPTAVAFSYDDPTIPAKVLTDFIKKNKIEHLRIKGCLFENEIYYENEVENIAKLPTKDELLAKFIATIQTPLSNLVATLSSPFTQLIGVLNALKEKKE
ncbi:MAG: 50S ribosomal protein L10 [Candidatus Marinimicrobia bacterium]|nr:50S ribosomal protein L10 [Candidatus Neomarinimicrobiota bacterium]